MRIVIHDYAGHAFPMQLGRELSRRGHAVLHLHLPEFQSPKGCLTARPSDPPTFQTKGVALDEPFTKSSLVRRWRQERAYGRRVAQRVRAFAPDAVLSNAPIDAQEIIQRACQSTGGRFVMWVQDLYSVAIVRLLGKKIGTLADAAGIYYRKKERDLLRKSANVVYIADDFASLTSRWQIDLTNCHVVENWAPLEEIRPVARDNPWAMGQGLAGKKCIMYAGTMAQKHDPNLLIHIAESWRQDERVAIAVVSEGPGRTCLEEQQRARGLSNLHLLDYQPHEQMSEVLSSADILIAMLNADAGSFSVPSKVLSYLCAGRPVLAAMPSDNLAAKTVLRARAGLVVEPDDVEGLIDATRRLLADETLRGRLGANGRQYAEEHFNIGQIAERFEAILSDGGKRRVSRPSAKLQPQPEQ